MPNDPVITNIAGLAMQILNEAQGVRDISGLHTGDAVESTAEPASGSDEIVISNGVPSSVLKSLICEYSIMQDGAGNPSLENVREIIYYSGEKITQIAENYKREINPKFDLISGTYNAITGEVVEQWGIIELGTIFDLLNAELMESNSHILRMRIPDSLVQEYPIDARSESRGALGINTAPVFLTSYNVLQNKRIGLYAGTGITRTLYYRNDDLDGLEALSDFVKENNLRFAFRLYDFRSISTDKAQFYLQSGNNVFSSENGKIIEIGYSAFPSPESLGNATASAPEQISRPETPAIVEPIAETPAIVEPIAEEITNQEDEEK